MFKRYSKRGRPPGNIKTGYKALKRPERVVSIVAISAIAIDLLVFLVDQIFTLHAGPLASIFYFLPEFTGRIYIPLIVYFTLIIFASARDLKRERAKENINLHLAQGSTGLAFVNLLEQESKTKGGIKSLDIYTRSSFDFFNKITKECVYKYTVGNLRMLIKDPCSVGEEKKRKKDMLENLDASNIENATVRKLDSTFSFFYAIVNKEHVIFGFCGSEGDIFPKTNNEEGNKYRLLLDQGSAYFVSASEGALNRNIISDIQNQFDIYFSNNVIEEKLKNPYRVDGKEPSNLKLQEDGKYSFSEPFFEFQKGRRN